ncbi:MAG: thioredoxin family protein [Chloroflexi bacterium]|nr:thioredoxin family protein [Chloroflexota bacterium]
MLNIKILGGGCANCKRLEQLARHVVEANSLEAEFEKVMDYAEIMKFGVMSTPGLVIDGKVVCSGRIPSEQEVSTWIKVV